MRARTIILALTLLGCTAPTADRIDSDHADHRQWQARPTIPAAATIEVERADLDVPDTCRRLVVTDTPSGPQLGKERSAWLADGAERWRRQQELRVLISIVAAEMGADELAAEMVWRKAILESSGDPSNVHVLTPDASANRAAASKGKRRSSDRWSDATVPVYRYTKRGIVLAGAHDAWALGRGLYGQVTGLHLHRWGSDVPPWSLCDPVIATVTAIWSMRAGLAECHGRSLRDAYRRFSSGKCALRSDDRERAGDRLARGRVRGLKLRRFDIDAPAVLGTRWPESGTDRAVLLARLRRLVAAETE